MPKSITERFWSAVEMQATALSIVQQYPQVLDRLWTPPDLSKDKDWMQFVALSAMRQVARASLVFGSPFYWAPHVLEIIRAAAETMPTWTFTVESLPTPHGFFWFDTPLPLVRHKDTPLMAVSWTSVAQTGETKVVDGKEMHGLKVVAGGDSIDAVYVAFWGKGHGPVTIVPYTMTPLFPGKNMNEYLETYRQSLEEKHDFNEDSLVDYHVKMRYLACCLSLLEQRIVGTRRVVGKLPRSIRRRLYAKPLKDAEATVSVITLRAYEQHRKDDEEEVGTVEWRVRWLVRGHWRHQWYAKEQVHKPKWIAPYVKGPADKPLRVDPKVFQVTR